MRYTKTRQGVRIAYEDINPHGKQNVVFLHGWPLDHRIFEYQYNLLLLEANLRCIAVDLRGFGASDVTSGGYDYNQQAEDLYDLLGNLGLEDVTLVGFDMGGAIAIRYMARLRGAWVKKLALLAPAAPCLTEDENVSCGMSALEMSRLLALAKTDRPKMVVEYHRKFFASNPSSQLRDWLEHIGWDLLGVATIQSGLALRAEDLRLDLPKIAVPTAIFQGKLDQICPYEQAVTMHNMIPNSTLHTFENSGHAIFYDELEAFNKAFLDFVLRA